MIKSLLRKTPLKRLWDRYKYYKSDFYKFEVSVPKQTRLLSNQILSWADQCAKNKDDLEAENLFLGSEDPIIRESYKLRSDLKKHFNNAFSNSMLRILVHVPDVSTTPAGYSLFNNLIESAEYLGYKIFRHGWYEATEDLLERYKPNLFLTSDSPDWLDRIDWDAIEKYREGNTLKVGLTASLEEEYNTALLGRLKWAKSHNVDFYYFYDSEEYLAERKSAYQPFFDEGYNIYSYEYTLNPLKYYPVPGLERDIDYVFMGSGYKHRSKERQYIQYFSGPLSKSAGFLYGPNWRGIRYRGIDNERDRFIYSRGKIGLNLSIGRQMKWSSVLNERTYMLAACGIPQLTDRPLLLKKRFADDELFVADSPQEYSELFFYILETPEDAQERALKSLRRVFSEHTNFHRCSDFFSRLEKDFVN
jgi:hypothetical protein